MAAFTDAVPRYLVNVCQYIFIASFCILVYFKMLISTLAVLTVSLLWHK